MDYIIKLQTFIFNTSFCQLIWPWKDTWIPPKFAYLKVNYPLSSPLFLPAFQWCPHSTESESPWCFSLLHHLSTSPTPEFFQAMSEWCRRHLWVQHCASAEAKWSLGILHSVRLLPLTAGRWIHIFRQFQPTVVICCRFFSNSEMQFESPHQFPLQSNKSANQHRWWTENWKYFTKTC